MYILYPTEYEYNLNGAVRFRPVRRSRNFFATVLLFILHDLIRYLTSIYNVRFTNNKIPIVPLSKRKTLYEYLSYLGVVSRSKKYIYIMLWDMIIELTWNVIKYSPKLRDIFANGSIVFRSNWTWWTVISVDLS